MAIYKGTEKIAMSTFRNETQGTKYPGEYKISPGVSDITIPKNTYMEQDLVIEGDANFIEKNIASGVNIFGKTGTVKSPAPNGTEWTQSNITNISFRCVYNANGIWVAGSYSSSNGLWYSVTWESKK